MNRRIDGKFYSETDVNELERELRNQNKSKSVTRSKAETQKPKIGLMGQKQLLKGK